MSTVLLFGSGGRESAIAWKLSQSSQVSQIVVAPGNAGMSSIKKTSILPCKLTMDQMLQLAQELQPDLIIIGPEQPLVDGVADQLQEHGFVVMGPHRLAARLEASKIFSKIFMTEFSIPTAEYAYYDGYDSALQGLEEWDFMDGIVIKSDALAGGKGVVLCDTKEEAQKVLFDFMKNPAVSVQTNKILFEKKLRGREVSAFALLDGENFVPLGYACDYKRVGDGDQGPNTGGMGTFTPSDFPDPFQKEQIFQIFQKVNQGMKSRGTPYQGILFAGLMIDGEGADSDVNIIEFNIRFGDPETQSLLPTVDEDLFALLKATAQGNLSQLSEQQVNHSLQTKKRAVHIVLASQGYPSLDKIKNPILTGQRISLPSTLPSQAKIFFAGVKEENGVLLNSGGRVLGVTYIGDSVKEARTGAYQIIEQIDFTGKHYRTDIAKGFV